MRTINTLSAIVSDIEQGQYTQDKAAFDYECMMSNDGLDFMSSLESYAFDATVPDKLAGEQ
jgi:hypothetical protein